MHFLLCNLYSVFALANQQSWCMDLLRLHPNWKMTELCTDRGIMGTLAKRKFLKLDGSHVEYVMGCMKETTTKITNIRAYLITALYNAPSTMSHC